MTTRKIDPELAGTGMPAPGTLSVNISWTRSNTSQAGQSHMVNQAHRSPRRSPLIATARLNSPTNRSSCAAGPHLAVDEPRRRRVRTLELVPGHAGDAAECDGFAPCVGLAADLDVANAEERDDHAEKHPDFPVVALEKPHGSIWMESRIASRSAMSCTGESGDVSAAIIRRVPSTSRIQNSSM